MAIPLSEKVRKKPLKKAALFKSVMLIETKISDLAG